ncbi:undecaprenyldiphospho-muramoylpentapeptide beta-N-acetylglucosaminyltransferase [Rubritalea spongiae]|uniref:UDP-N-acetylglucosamine--N-acetylmuramyl-(pentapeptide) pyrophosphoryl-undecaprenol N-acetylglucosamine transferase n=1 Tax=Rubritalea spongiae TaxID=430797 RepID=A0ABW5E403_9BACT
MESKKKVVIACGGTGGHLFPGVAVAQEMKCRGHDVRLLISEKKVDAEASAKYGDLAFDTVPAVAKPATLSPKMIPFLWKLWKTTNQCKALLKEFGADAVVGMGGFTSLPPVVAGKKMGARTFVHDSNAVPGRANRLTARWCDKVLLGMEAARQFFPNSEVEITGTPVREEIQQLPSREEAAKKLGLDPELKTVLVMGGSQGAKQLNSLVVEASKAMPEVQFVHITGNFDYDRVKAELGDNCPTHHLIKFCDDMASVYAVSDLALIRSGASSLSEISYLGIASILVPYPYAADDHQTKNAEVFVEADAAVLRQEADLDAGVLVADVTAILGDTERLVNMSSASAALGVKDAATRVCAEVEKV